MTVERLVLDGYSEPEAFQEGAGSVTVETEFVEDYNGRAPLRRETVVTNQAGTVVRRVVEEWSYDEYGTRYPPTLYKKEIYGNAYLPSANEGRALILLERVTTAYWLDAVFLSETSEFSYRTLREGYVVYDLYHEDQTADADAQAKMEAQGRSVPDGQIGRRILSTARAWDSATTDGSVIELEDTPQTALWQRISMEEFRVTETWAYVVEYRVRKDYLHPGAVDVEGPTYRARPGVTYDLPVRPEPPKVRPAGADDTGQRVEVKARGVRLKLGGLVNREVVIPPTAVRVLRRTVQPASRPVLGDLFGLEDQDPGSASRLAPPFSETGTDLAGAPLPDTLPAQTSYTEDGDSSAPVVETWRQVAEVQVDPEQVRDGVVTVTITDEDVEDGAVYEYRGVTVVREQESDLSAGARTTYAGGKTYSSGLRVYATVRRLPDGGRAVEVAAEAPEDPEVWAADFGETITLGDVPIDLGVSMDLEDYDGVIGVGGPGSVGWDEELVQAGHQVVTAAARKAAKTWGEALALQHMVRDSGGWALRITPAFPLFPLRRGMLVSAGDTGWTWIGDGVIGSVTSALRPGVLEGWTLTFRAEQGGPRYETGALTVEVLA